MKSYGELVNFKNKAVEQTHLIRLLFKLDRFFVSESRIKWNKLKRCRGIKAKIHNSC